MNNFNLLNNYTFFSSLFKYILEKYYNPEVKQKEVLVYKGCAVLTIYTIKPDSVISGTNSFGIENLTGDWYYNGEWKSYLNWVAIKDLCFIFSKKIGYG
jgi:hypothetical protein